MRPAASPHRVVPTEAARGGPLRVPAWLAAAVAVTLAAIWASAGSTARVHWDEPGYWYAAAYTSVPEILAGDFQPSGLECFTMTRIGHILFLKLLIGFAGPGAASLRCIMGAYLLMLVAFLAVTHRILRALTPESAYAGAAVTLGALTPVLVYLAFKTLAEIPAVLLASVAALAFLRSLRAGKAQWLLVVGATLAGVAFTKNHMVVLDVSLAAALVLCGGIGFPVRRILVHAIASGTAALSIFLILLRIAGIPLQRYFGLAHWFSGLAEPVEVRFLQLALECGPFLLALPVAFLARDKARARFFSLWFLLATAPLLFAGHLEARYLVANFVPLAGLVQLSLDGIASRARQARTSRRAGAALVASVALPSVALVALSQQVMYYGVRSDELAEILRRLDGSHGRDRTVIVTPNEYPTFLFLRFAYPERAICTVFTAAPPDHRDPRAWPAFQREHYGTHAVQTLEELAALGDDIVYLGTESDLTVADFRHLAERMPRTSARRWAEDLLAALNPFDPFVLSWMWSDPRVRLSDEVRVGHYRAMRVTILPTVEPAGAGNRLASLAASRADPEGRPHARSTDQKRLAIVPPRGILGHARGRRSSIPDGAGEDRVAGLTCPSRPRG